MARAAQAAAQAAAAAATPPQPPEPVPWVDSADNRLVLRLVLTALVPNAADRARASLVCRPWMNAVSLLTPADGVAYRYGNMPPPDGLSGMGFHFWGKLCFAYSPNGLLLCTGLNHGNFLIQKASNGATLRLIAIPGAETEILKARLFDMNVNDVKFSLDSQRILACTDDKNAYVYQVETGELVATLPHLHEVVCGSYGEALIATGSRDKCLRLWSSKTFDLVRTIGNPSPRNGGWMSQGWLTCALSPAGDRLAAGRVEDHYVYVFDVYGERRQPISMLATPAQTGTSCLLLKGHDSPVVTLSWSPDGKRLVSASGLFAKIWSSTEGSALLTLAGHEEPIFQAVWAGRSGLIIAIDCSMSQQPAIQLFSPETGVRLGGRAQYKLLAAAVSPCGRAVVCSGMRGPSVVCELPANQGKCDGIACSNFCRGCSVCRPGRMVPAVDKDSRPPENPPDQAQSVHALRSSTRGMIFREIFREMSRGPSVF